MPFTVNKAELDRYAAGLERAVALDLHGALSWFGADEDGATVRVSRHDLQQFLHYALPRKYLIGVEEHAEVPELVDRLRQQVKQRTAEPRPRRERDQRQQRGA